MNRTRYSQRLVCALAVLSIGLSAQARRGPFNTYLDPNNAERTLASLGGRARLMDDKWLSLIGPKRYETYTVVPGDSLWGISQRVLGDAFLWRKLWEENPFLTNPHELTAGQILNYYREGRNLASENVIRIPLIHLRPGGRGKVADLESDTFLAVDIKNKYRPAFFVLTPEDKMFGEISGSYTERDGMGVHEAIYIKPGESNLSPGETYSIVHVERTLRDRTQLGAPVLGSLVRYVGEVEITENGEKLVKGQLKSTVHIVKRGDQIITQQKPTKFAISKNPPNELQTRIVQGEEPEAKMFGQGQIVLLNKGTVDGVEAGYVFRVFHETDKKTEKTEDVEPESKGEVQIIHAGPLSAIGYILRSTEPLSIGDTCIPRQAFTDREPPPRKNTENLEID